jgi:DNA mismatch repair ATPase MutS
VPCLPQGSILLYQLGYYFQAFGDGAIAISRILNLNLINHRAGTPMTGIPHHTLDKSVETLTQSGYGVKDLGISQVEFSSYHVPHEK